MTSQKHWPVSNKFSKDSCHPIKSLKEKQRFGWMFRLIMICNWATISKTGLSATCFRYLHVIWGSWYSIILPTHVIFQHWLCVSYLSLPAAQIHIWKDHHYIIAISWATQLSACWCILGQWNNLRLYVKFLPLLWIKHDKHEPPAHGCVLLPHPTN